MHAKQTKQPIFVTVYFLTPRHYLKKKAFFFDIIIFLNLNTISTMVSRPDRRDDNSQLRAFSASQNILNRADGSSKFEFGKTSIKLFL